MNQGDVDVRRDERIELLESKVDHLEQLLERMQAALERAAWENRNSRGGY